MKKLLAVSTGIGGGAILNGKIYRGSTSNALEVGHTTVIKYGPRCGCGNKGCSERISSGIAIAKQAIEAVNRNVETTLKNYKNVSAKEVFIESAKGDYVANSIRYINILKKGEGEYICIQLNLKTFIMIKFGVEEI